MRIFISILVFFFTSTPMYSNSIDTNDKNKITKHFNAYVDNGSLPNISILIKKDNKEIYWLLWLWQPIFHLDEVEQK